MCGPKYALLGRCQQGRGAGGPAGRVPLEKGRPGPGLLAHVVSSKYADHLPLYRLEQIFARHGVQITRRTLSEWNGAVADLLEPIVRIMHREQVCQSPWIQCDDTTLEVQDPSRAPEIRTGHLWVYRGELGEVVYDFTWSRNRDGPLKMLANYRGYLQVDAAPAYDDVFCAISRDHRSRMHGARPGGTSRRRCRRAAVPVRAGVGHSSSSCMGSRRAASDKRLDAPRTTTAAAGTSAADPGETACVSAGPAGRRRYRKSPLGAAIGYAPAQLGRP